MRTIIGERRPYDKYDVRSRDCNATNAHISYGKLSNGTSGVHPTCLLKKTQSSFEEAHHWNIPAKFYSVRIPTQLCMNDMKISMKYKQYFGARVWIFQNEQQCCPLLSFYFFFSFFFLFFYFFGLNGSFYLSLFFLFGIFCLSSIGIFYLCYLWGILLTLRATLYILQGVQKIAHFTRSTQHKEN